MAWLVSQVNVTETKRAVAIVTESPGIAPTNSPAIEPKNTNIKKFKSTIDNISLIIFITSFSTVIVHLVNWQI